uniref:adenosine deaminase isoform X2 n=1 Tax=Myxine glutinosa TaxID=7769 RepID=UPI00358ED3AB
MEPSPLLFQWRLERPQALRSPPAPSGWTRSSSNSLVVRLPESKLNAHIHCFVLLFAHLWNHHHEALQFSIHSFKQVELHVHLDGAIRLETIAELARGDKEAIRRVAYELVQDKAREGVVYLEVRYSPQLLATADVEPKSWGLPRGDLDPNGVVEAVSKGLREGAAEFSVITRSILCCMRHRPAWSPEVLRLCVRHGGVLDIEHENVPTNETSSLEQPMVVGMDLAGDESLVTVAGSGHIQAFQEARRMGIHRTVHAGEAGPASVVREAVTKLKAERIGHGYHLLEDLELYHLLLQQQIHFEMCPWSSYITGAYVGDFNKHPLIRFLADGASVSLNTDDPLILGSTLETDYCLARRHMSCTDENFIAMNMAAASASFLPRAEKDALMESLRNAYGLTST